VWKCPGTGGPRQRAKQPCDSPEPKAMAKIALNMRYIKVLRLGALDGMKMLSMNRARVVRCSIHTQRICNTMDQIQVSAYQMCTITVPQGPTAEAIHETLLRLFGVLGDRNTPQASDRTDAPKIRASLLTAGSDMLVGQTTIRRHAAYAPSRNNVSVAGQQNCGPACFCSWLWPFSSSCRR